MLRWWPDPSAASSPAWNSAFEIRSSGRSVGRPSGACSRRRASTRCGASSWFTLAAGVTPYTTVTPQAGPPAGRKW